MRHDALIDLRVLGPVHVLVEGEPAPSELLWKKHLALLVYLAMAERPVSREHLVGLLWAEKPDAAARHSLNEALRVLRRVTGAESIAGTGGQLTMTAGTVTLDTTRFVEAETAGRWEEAAGLVVGPFLEGFGVPDASGFEDWLAAERARWSHRSATALTHHAQDLYRAGRLTEAIEVGTRALHVSPHADAALGIVMRSLAVSGNRAAAIELHERHSTAMREFLGTSPGRDIGTLVARIREDHLAHPAPVSVTDSPLALPLVGRTGVLESLSTLGTRIAREAQCGIGIVLGDEGCGKTRLLAEVTSRLRLDGWTVLETSAVPGDQTGAWGTFLALARQAATIPGVGGAHPEAIRTFVERFDVWSEHYRGIGSGPSMAIEPALRDVLSASLEESPMVVVLDDAHWMDHESLRAISLWFREFTGRPLLCLLSATTSLVTEDIDYLRSRVGRDMEGEVITLGPLSSSDLGELVRSQLPDWTPVEVERLVRRLATDSAGIPLLATLLLSAVTEGLQPEGGAWPAPMQTLDQSLPVDLPDGVVAALRVRFHRLDADSRTLLGILGVVEGRLEESDAADLTEWPLDRVHATFDALERSRWITGDARGFAIAGRIVREVIGRDMVTPGQRRRILARRSPEASSPPAG